MSMRKVLLAVTAVTALALAAMPSVASAAFETSPSVSPAPVSYTSTSGEGSLLAEGSEPVECVSDTNVGEFEEGGKTGTATVTFEGCKTHVFGFPVNCNTSGLGAGVIQTEELITHLVYLKPANPENPHEKPGILFTPAASGVFAAFECGGGLAQIEVTGNGVLGAITNPSIGEESTTATIEVNATSEGQEYTETVEGGTTYGLESSTNGEPPVSAFENAGEDLVSYTTPVTLNTE